MFDQLHEKLEGLSDGKFHVLSQGLREEVERVSKREHHWEAYNVDQLVGTWEHPPSPHLSLCSVSLLQDELAFLALVTMQRRTYSDSFCIHYYQYTCIIM